MMPPFGSFNRVSHLIEMLLVKDALSKHQTSHRMVFKFFF